MEKLPAFLIPEPFRFPKYSPELETHLSYASRERVRAIQSARLRHIVEHAAKEIPFYRDLWKREKVDIREIQTIDDLVKLPTWNVETQRRTIEECPPYGNCYSSELDGDIAFMLSTSGTTGVPRLFPVGYKDLPGFQDIMARCYHSVGLTSRDLMQVTFTYATMGAAWACTWAAQGAGVGLLPASSGRTTESARQVDLIRRAGVTGLTGTASFILHLAEVAQRQGYDPSEWKVRTIITAGELASPGTRKAIEQAWGAKCYDLFGSVDTLTWSSIDCEASRAKHGALGMHMWEDACKIEVLDPDGKPVPPGEYGEMCITSWAWRTSPKIRFRSGDLIAVKEEPCECGRTLARMMPVAGRVDHVLRLNATTIFPMAIENAILGAAPHLSEWVAEAVLAERGDRLTIRVETSNIDDTSLRDRLTLEIGKKLNLRALELTLVPPGSTADITGAGKEPKVRRIFDRRRRS